MGSRGNRTTKQISVYLIPEHIKKLDELVKKGLYGSRNEVIRVAITDLLRAEAKWELDVGPQMLHRIDLAARAQLRGIRIKGEEVRF